MTPYTYSKDSPSVFVVHSSDLCSSTIFFQFIMHNTLSIRPVLSIKSCATWKSGNGASNTPYEVELDSTCASVEN